MILFEFNPLYKSPFLYGTESFIFFISFSNNIKSSILYFKLLKSYSVFVDIYSIYLAISVYIQESWPIPHEYLLWMTTESKVTTSSYKSFKAKEASSKCPEQIAVNPGFFLLELSYEKHPKLLFL